MSAALTAGGVALLLAVRTELRQRILLKALLSPEQLDVVQQADRAMKGAATEALRVALEACGVSDEEGLKYMATIAEATSGAIEKALSK
ncbi:hypothetical protein E7T09_04565 [Deinococcus sp. KSM4-11]|uniref:hypothetical protein n=1 Tax=Deinococcus sp. KSM4-11 TaxID=2568654 RepID=UPI0010A3B20D|nr:hypothetical protein [Deinococcus sp. KSM4-11]THF88484.1 hypothetical protein E7T09_04565 [Deinococcus sp. KSM4-11]